MIEPTREQDERARDLAGRRGVAQVRCEPLSYEGAPLQVTLYGQHPPVQGEDPVQSRRNGFGPPMATVFIYADGEERWS